MLLSCSHYKEKGERHGRCEPMCEKTTRAARCAHDARAFARFAEARRAYGAHGPQARRARTLGPRWIRWQSACNPRWKQGHATWKTRWNRVGFAPDPRGIPARPTPTKRKMASLQWKSGPAQTKQRTGGAFGEDCHARKFAPFTASGSLSIGRRTLRTTRRTSMLPTEASRRYTQRRESCLRASFLLDKRSSLLHGLLCTSPSLTTIGTLQARTEPVFALTR